MSGIILHHYDFSSFAEKTRLILGLKRLSWHSVIQPMILPKPGLRPLTGGYRRVPVMQIGADVYCDSSRIAVELERRFPQFSLFPGGTQGLCEGLSMWADSTLMWAAGRFATGLNTRHLPREFYDDRSAMWGLPPSVERARAATAHYREQLRVQLAWVEQMASRDTPFILGEEPSLADFAVYQPLWFVRQNGEEAAAALEPYPALVRWMERVAAIGHGKRAEIDPQKAFEVARAAEPEAIPPGGNEGEGAVEGVRLEGQVTVTPTDYARDPVSGLLVALTPNTIAVRRADPAVGSVVVHFPRLNYRVRSL